MIAQCLDVIKTLLADEHSASIQTDLAESLLVLSFKMALKRCHIWELRSRTITARYYTIQCAQLKTCFLSLRCMVVDGIILRILVTFLKKTFGRKRPSEISISSDDDFVKVRSTNGTLFILHDQPGPERTRVAHFIMIARTKCKEIELRAAQYACWLA